MTVVDNYLKDVSAPQRQKLERVREVIRITTPKAEEVITYGMPGLNIKRNT